MNNRISAILLGALLAGCHPQQAQDVPPPPPSPAPAPAESPAPAAPADVTPADPAAPSSTDPTTTPAAPAQPAPAAPPPTEPSPAPTPTAANTPAVDSMALARPSAKLGVAVDLRYKFDGAISVGQPVTLHLAAVPRVAGSNFSVVVKPAAGLEFTNGTLAAQKVDAAGVYRQQLSVTRRSDAAEQLRVLVTMDMPEGTVFGFYSIPFDAGTTAQKSDSVKLR
jgi:hypothetical protein